MRYLLTILLFISFFATAQPPVKTRVNGNGFIWQRGQFEKELDLPVFATDPVGSFPFGATYFNSTDSTQRFWNGVLWIVKTAKPDSASTTATAIQASRQTGFPNVAAMLSVGDTYRQSLGLYRTFTQDFYTPGSGGGAIYNRLDSYVGIVDSMTTFYGGTGVWQLEYGSEVNVLQLGFKGDGTTNDIALLRKAIANAKIRTLVFPDSRLFKIVGSVNAGGKTFRFQSGKIIGACTISNVNIDADRTAQIFDTSVKVTGIPYASIAWWGARRDYSINRIQRLATQAAINSVIIGGRVDAPADSVLGSSYYWMDSTVTVRQDIIFIGDGSFHEPRSAFIWKANIIGMNLLTPARVTMSNWKLLSETPAGWATFDDWDTTIHAIVSNTFMYFDNNTFQQWGGDGIHLNTVVGTSNADHSRIERCYFTDVNNGIYVSGGDANIMSFIQNDFTLCRRWGHYSNSFLGNYQQLNHFAGCGTTNRTLTNYGGITYRAINKIGVENKNKRPDLSPTYWKVLTEYNFPSYGQWDSTKNYYSGGTVAVVDVNAVERIVDNYYEGYGPGYLLSGRAHHDGGFNPGGGDVGGVSTGVVDGSYVVGAPLDVKADAFTRGIHQADYFHATTNNGFLLDLPGFPLGTGITGYSNHLEFISRGNRRAYFDNLNNYLRLDQVPSDGDSSDAVPTTAFVDAVLDKKVNFSDTARSKYIPTYTYVDSLFKSKTVSITTTSTGSTNLISIATASGSGNIIEFTLVAKDQTNGKMAKFHYEVTTSNVSGTLTVKDQEQIGLYLDSGVDVSYEAAASGANLLINAVGNSNTVKWTLKIDNITTAQ